KVYNQKFFYFPQLAANCVPTPQGFIKKYKPLIYIPLLIRLLHSVHYMAFPCLNFHTGAQNS
ncbi:MAG: hypothetical protein V3R23_03560, partial [Nitrospinaceae bacterium]